MQEVDAERRLAILRGEKPLPLPAVDELNDAAGTRSRERRPRDGHLEPRKRKRAGEDDTDFELRVATERAQSTALVPRDVPKKPISSAPIVDRNGNIDLFGDDPIRGRVQKNEDAEREKAKKKKEYEDQYTMRFSNAEGKSGSRAWYAKPDADLVVTAEEPGKNAFGHEDPERKARDAARIGSSDPLSMMKKGAAKVRELAKERNRANGERERELRELRREERRREKRRRRHEGDSERDHGLRSDGKSQERMDHRERGGDEYRRSGRRGDERDVRHLSRYSDRTRA
jgi:hypothetical protein